MADDIFSNSEEFFRDLESIYGQGPEISADQDADKILEGLNKEQMEAVTHLDGPLLILAGAGSGKTRVITYRIAYMMKKHNVAPSSILAITFTNKAANEMRQRIEGLVGDRSKYIWCGTFHSIFARLLRRHAELLGYSQNFSIIDSDDQLKLIKEAMKELDIADSQFKPKSVQIEISNAKNKFVGVEEYQLLAGKEYFLLFRALPREYWGKYLPNSESLSVLSWLVQQPAAVRTALARFSPDEAAWLMRDVPAEQVLRFFTSGKSDDEVRLEFARLKKLPKADRVPWQSQISYYLHYFGKWGFYAICAIGAFLGWHILRCLF